MEALNSVNITEGIEMIKKAIQIMSLLDEDESSYNAVSQMPGLESWEKEPTLKPCPLHFYHLHNSAAPARALWSSRMSDLCCSTRKLA